MSPLTEDCTTECLETCGSGECPLLARGEPVFTEDTEQAVNPCAVEWRPGDAPGISYGQLDGPGLEFMRVEYGGDVTIHSRPLGACHGSLPPWELLLTIRQGG